MVPKIFNTDLPQCWQPINPSSNFDFLKITEELKEKMKNKIVIFVTFGSTESKLDSKIKKKIENYLTGHVCCVIN